ncbi:unnamed protein product [Amoebophrya sp. A25]|nr:unnamed protein product [Amoebophrya sp. A25]|eukprot:GSA25T00015445001.1
MSAAFVAKKNAQHGTTRGNYEPEDSKPWSLIHEERTIVWLRGSKIQQMGQHKTCVRLSPFDLMSQGRAVPLCYFFNGHLDTARLHVAIRNVLEAHNAYHILCGRYDTTKWGKVRLTNEGVPVHVAYLRKTENNDESVGESVGGKPTYQHPAVGHILSGDGDAGTEAKFFDTWTHESFVPDKNGIDPDPGSPTTPLLAVKLTLLFDKKVGTTEKAGNQTAALPDTKGLSCCGSVLGLLVQHSILDADAMFTLVRRWAAEYTRLGRVGEKGEDVEDSTAIEGSGEANDLAEQDHGHDDEDYSRWLPAWSSKDLDGASTSKTTSDSSCHLPKHPFKVRAIPPGVPPIPEFAPVLQKIHGTTVCVVPCSAAFLRNLKQRLCAQLETTQLQAVAASSCVISEMKPPHFISTDDALTALIWRSMVRMRWRQLTSEDGAHPFSADEADFGNTTCSRASNFRNRTTFGPNYVGNGVCSVFTERPIAEFLENSQSTGENSTSSSFLCSLALSLRQDLELQHSADEVDRRGKWLYREQMNDSATKLVWDDRGMTFIISSWNFDWEGARFGDAFSGDAGTPILFDHGANVPVVSVFVPRPKGDGFNVYCTGPRPAMEQFALEMRPDVILGQ